MPKYKYRSEGRMIEWTPEQIRTYLHSKNISEEDMTSCRGGSWASRLFAVGELFCQKGFHDFSGMDIAFVLYCDEFGTKKAAQNRQARVSAAISRLYRHERDTLRALNMPCIHYLRMQTGNNVSNLHEMHGYCFADSSLEQISDDPHPGIKQSYEDWQDGVCLPETIDFDEARLLGYIWSLGTIVPDKVSPWLTLSSRRHYRELLREHVQPLAERVFNVSFHTVQQDLTDSGIFDASSFQGVSIKRSSQAITSYLQDVHGFPMGTRQVGELPRLEWTPEQIEGFTLGVVTSLSRQDAGRLRIGRLSRPFGIKLFPLMNDIGYKPGGPWTRESGYWEMELKGPDVARIRALEMQAYAGGALHTPAPKPL